MSKILVVDDEVQIRTLLSRMLELEGYEVCQAGDCRTALKQLEFQSPDVVLCDVFLPDGNGVDLVSSVKKRFFMNTHFFTGKSGGERAGSLFRRNLPVKNCAFRNKYRFTFQKEYAKLILRN